MAVPELQFGNIGTNFLNAYRQGQQRARGEQFNRLAGQAAQASPAQRDALIAQAVELDPSAGLRLGEELQVSEDRRRTQLYNMARGFKTIHGSNPAAAASYYQTQLVPGLQRLGFEVPAQYDEATVIPVVDQVIAAGSGAARGAGQAEFEYLTQGLSPEDVQRARRVELGLDPRAVTGAARNITVKGRDGLERQGYFDPTTRQTFVLDERTNQFRPLGAGETIRVDGAQAPIPAAPATDAVSFEGLTPEQNQRLSATASFMRQQGFPEDQIVRFLASNDPGVGTAPAQVVQAPAGAPASLGVGRSPEEEAFATELAKQQAQIATYRERAGLEAEGAEAKAEATERGKATGERAAGRAKRAQDAQNVNGLLDEALPLIRASTGSGLGALRDRGGRIVGYSGPGAQAIAALKPIAAGLTANVPRFEGPQSNADVQAYREAAGDLANPEIPIEERLAAVATIRRLQQKYIDQAGESSPAGNRTRYDAQGNRL